MSLHLLAAISSHGFGHLAQIAPLINALQRLCERGLMPAFDLTMRSSMPKQQLAWRIARPFELDAGSDDFGMVMRDALRVDLVTSLRQYAALHEHWHAHVNRLATHLQSLGLTHLVADAPYLTLAAAKAANVPAAAICSLNWADILERCVDADPGALKQAGVSSRMLAEILTQMRDAYASAAIVIRPQPAIATTGFETVTTEPLADAPAQTDRTALLAFVRQAAGNYLSANEDAWLVLTSMGGIALPLHPERWPRKCLGRKVIYLMDPSMAKNHRHTVGFDLAVTGFAQMMASCDAVLTKPGYGMFVEARSCGKPMLYIARDDWPESACLEQWANQHTHAQKLSLAQVITGAFDDELTASLTAPGMNRVEFEGADQTARHLVKHLFDL